MNELERFLGVMDYKPVDRAPNHELGVWSQTVERWKSEGMPEGALFFDWFVGEDYIGLDHREYAPLDFSMIPPFDVEVIERTDEYEIVRHPNGIVTKALTLGTVNGMRMCMDQYMEFPVSNLQDFRELRKRYEPLLDRRYPANWRSELAPSWRSRTHPLILCRNAACGGFYWRGREWMGTENLSFAWYDQPELAHEMMEFYADFTMQVAAPLLSETTVDYFTYNEDFAMKSGPLLSPATFKEFIFPHMKRVNEFLKSHGVRYIALDSDGAPEPLVPLLMDAGVDILWPLERASEGVDPLRYRRKFGKSLRLMGGIDKRELAKGPAAIDAHLAELAPLVEEGGYIPTVDHCVSPEVSWENFLYYMEQKRKLLEGRL